MIRKNIRYFQLDNCSQTKHTGTKGRGSTERMSVCKVGATNCVIKPLRHSFLSPSLPGWEGIAVEISTCRRNNTRVKNLVSSASVAVRTECFFCGRVSGVISGRAGCPCSRPFFLGPCAVSLDTANEKMAVGQPGPLTLLWPVFRAPASHLQLNRCAGWPCSTVPAHWKHFSSYFFFFYRVLTVILTSSFYNIISILSNLFTSIKGLFLFITLVLNTKSRCLLLFLVRVKTLILFTGYADIKRSELRV